MAVHTAQARRLVDRDEETADHVSRLARQTGAEIISRLEHERRLRRPTKRRTSLAGPQLTRPSNKELGSRR